MLKKLSLFLTALLCISFFGCTEKENNSAEIVYQTVTENTVSETEIISVTESEIVTKTIETTVNTESTTVSLGTESSIVSSEVSEIISQESITETTFQEITVTQTEDYNNSDDIEVIYNSEDLSAENMQLIIDYYMSIYNCDVEKYTSMLIPVFTDYLDSYLKENGFTTLELLQKNNEQILNMTNGKEYKYSKAEITVLKENDFKELNFTDYATEYKKQLDELSYQKDKTYVSETFENSYTIMFNMYIKDTDGKEYCIINKGALCIFETADNKYIMANS